MHTMTGKKVKSGTIDVKALLAGDEEFLRAPVRAALQEVLEVEMSEALCAEKGERAAGRAILEVLEVRPTLCWREMDSNPRSPCGGWRLGLLPQSYGKFRRANCGSHLTHRWRKPDSNFQSPWRLRTLRPVGDRSPREKFARDSALEGDGFEPPVPHQE
jgi:hypothetical protein